MIAKKRTGPPTPIPTIRIVSEPLGELPDLPRAYTAAQLKAAAKRQAEFDAMRNDSESFKNYHAVPARPRNKVKAEVIHLVTDYYQSETREPTLNRRLTDGFRMIKGDTL